MTTADQIGFRSWLPAPVATAHPDDDYVGRHRKTGVRSLSLHRMFYTPRHLLQRGRR